MFTRPCFYTIALSFIVCAFCNCKTSRVTIIGTALDSKPSAIVTTDSGHYYINRLGDWDEKYLGKKVRVTGRLKVKVHEKQSTDSVQVQEIVGQVAILKRARWRLAE